MARVVTDNNGMNTSRRISSRPLRLGPLVALAFASLLLGLPDVCNAQDKPQDAGLKARLEKIRQRALRLSEASDKIQKEAEAGDARAQYRMGMGIADPAEQVRWLRLSADQGHAPAMTELGRRYAKGDGISKDTPRAIEWYVKAAEQGDASAQGDLGWIYYLGDGVIRDVSTAVEWFTKAAEQGDASAQGNLGRIYRTGDGVPVDMAKAIEWYTRAAAQGDVVAQRTLGLLYCTGDGATWYGVRETPQGAERSVPRDMAKAIEWYGKAAEQGDALAQSDLGFIFGSGDGVAKDMARAIEWWTKAAEQGVESAQFNLGVIYGNGKGVPQDFAAALMWYTRAANQGQVDSQFNLSGMYARGEGVPQDYVQAYAWANIAAAGEDRRAKGDQPSAIKRRDFLAQQMTASQVAEGQRIAAAFKPQWEFLYGKPADRSAPPTSVEQADASGSGFFVSADGYFVTNHHVVAGAKGVSVRTAGGTFPAEVVRRDETNDLALLKVGGKFTPLHVAGSRSLRVGDRVVTVGFPNPNLQGLAAKFSGGDVAALSGPTDDPRLLQISVPVQPGNSGGPLVNAKGEVVGVVVGRLDQMKTLKITGNLPENVNYAIKGTHLLALLESVPGLMDGLPRPPKVAPADQSSLVAEVERACGLVLIRR